MIIKYLISVAIFVKISERLTNQTKVKKTNTCRLLFSGAINWIEFSFFPTKNGVKNSALSDFDYEDNFEKVIFAKAQNNIDLIRSWWDNESTNSPRKRKQKRKNEKQKRRISV